MARRLLMTAILQSNFLGGTERAFLQLLAGIPADEYEVAVGLDETMLASEFAQRVEALGHLIIPFCDVVSKKDLTGMYRTISQVRKFRPDLVHVHLNHPLANPFFVFAAKVAGAPRIVLTEHLNVWLPQARFGQVRIRAYCSLADKIVAVSGAVRSGLTSHYGIKGDNIVVIENAVDVEEIAGKAKVIDRTTLRQSLGFTPGTFLLGCVAVLRWQKGHHYLLDAMPTVLDALPNVRLVLIGDGEGRADVEAWICERGLAGFVKILGWRSDTADLLAILDAFVLPSLYEGLPLAILEAMAAHLPIVATDIGGTSEAIQHRVSGILVPPKDAAALASSILEIAGDPRLAKALANAAEQRARAKYDISVMRHRYLELYRHVLGDGPAAANCGERDTI